MTVNVAFPHIPKVTDLEMEKTLPTWSQGTTDVMYWICMLNRQQVPTLHVFYFSQTIRIDAQASNKKLLQLGHNLAVKIYMFGTKSKLFVFLLSDKVHEFQYINPFY